MFISYSNIHLCRSYNHQYACFSTFRLGQRHLSATVYIITFRVNGNNDIKRNMNEKQNITKNGNVYVQFAVTDEEWGNEIKFNIDLLKQLRRP